MLTQLGSWFAGRVRDRVDFGDHVGFVLDPIEVQAGDIDEALTFRRGRWIEPGHEP